MDINRFMGKWYEIARFENWFEKGKFDASAEYFPLPDGRVKVVNSSSAESGKRSSVEGQAYIPDPRVPAKLRVSFFYPFYGDYWILELDDNYQWALVSGGNDDSLLWILARTPEISANLKEKICRLARARGYDTEKFVFNSEIRR